MNETNFRPQDDLDGWVSLEQLEQRIQYCLDESNRMDRIPDGKGGSKLVPGEWSDQYGARRLYLEDILESWEDLEKNELGQIVVNEIEYKWMLDNLCEDEGYPDVYENGPESLYSWMCWAKSWDSYTFAEDLKEWMGKEDLPTPEWAKDPDTIWYSYFCDE